MHIFDTKDEFILHFKLAKETQNHSASIYYWIVIGYFSPKTVKKPAKTRQIQKYSENIPKPVQKNSFFRLKTALNPSENHSKPSNNRCIILTRQINSFCISKMRHKITQLRFLLNYHGMHFTAIGFLQENEKIMIMILKGLKNASLFLKTFPKSHF